MKNVNPLNIRNPIRSSKNLRINPKFRSGGILGKFVFRSGQKLYQEMVRRLQLLIRNKNNGLPDDWGRTFHQFCIRETVLSMKLYSRRFGKMLTLLVSVCCKANIISVCLNTPTTFHIYPWLRYLTVIIDSIIATTFTTEMACKINFRGLVSQKNSYLRSAVQLFELFMLIAGIRDKFLVHISPSRGHIHY